MEPAEPAPIAAFKDAVKRRAGSLLPYQMAASEFDVAFITPVLNFAAQSQPNQNFSNWSDYVADIPPVLFVRVTPKMAESFWAKVARGAAYTQGMALPALKRLKSGFQRLQAYLRPRGGHADPSLQTRTARLRDGRRLRRLVRVRSGSTGARMWHGDACAVFGEGARESRHAGHRSQDSSADLAGLRSRKLVGATHASPANYFCEVCFE